MDFLMHENEPLNGSVFFFIVTRFVNRPRQSEIQMIHIAQVLTTAVARMHALKPTDIIIQTDNVKVYLTV